MRRSSSRPTGGPGRSAGVFDDLEEIALGGLEEEALVGRLSQGFDEAGAVVHQALLESIEVFEVMKESDVAAEFFLMR